MIQDRAEALVSLIERQRELREHLHLLDGFRARGSEVAAARKRLEDLVKVWSLFKTRGIGLPDLPQTIGGVLEEVKLLREQFTADPTHILGANRLAIVKSSIPVLASSLEQGLLGAWQVYASERAPRVNMETLIVLEKVGPLRTQVDRVSRGLRSLNELTRTLPRTEREIDEFDKSASHVNAAWSQLDSDHLRADVLQFLKAAGSTTGASLDLFTEPVGEWLRAHKLETAFLIRSSSTVIF
jgi:hypothetical protein